MTVYFFIEMVCASISLAIYFMAISLLMFRPDPNGIYKPLTLFFLASLLIEVSVVFDGFHIYGFMTPIAQNIEILSIPPHLILAPTLWLYVRGVTSETRIPVSKSDVRHFIPAIYSIFICALLLLSPSTIRNQITAEGYRSDSLWVLVLTFMLISLIIIWSVQVVSYIVGILRRLVNYRRRLKDIFASTDGREMNWLLAMVVLFAGVIIILIPDLIFGFTGRMSYIPSVLGVLLAYFLAIWGLRQKPGFILPDEMVLPLQLKLDGAQNSNNESVSRYEKSALTNDDITRIAKKISTAMQMDELYLDPNLSLRSLSKHISVSHHYVSQTLNGHMGESFFDYINRWRIEHSKTLLTNRTETVLDVAYDSGFNSRSSFYKAFKKETGKTPAAFRKASLSH